MLSLPVPTQMCSALCDGVPPAQGASRQKLIKNEGDTIFLNSHSWSNKLLPCLKINDDNKKISIWKAKLGTQHLPWFFFIFQSSTSLCWRLTAMTHHRRLNQPCRVMQRDWFSQLWCSMMRVTLTRTFSSFPLLSQPKNKGKVKHLSSSHVSCFRAKLFVCFLSTKNLGCKKLTLRPWTRSVEGCAGRAC